MPKVMENIQIGLAGCRIAFRRCCKWLICSNQTVEPREQYEVLCLGLSGAGKSTALATLVGEPTEDIEPTSGFNIKTLPVNDTVLNIKELGGTDTIRPFWKQYFDGVHGILFVLDAASGDSSLKAARDTLKEVVSDAALKGKPCVILATHQDVDGTATMAQVEQLLQGILHGRKSVVLPCSRGERQCVLKGLETLTDYMTPSQK